MTTITTKDNTNRSFAKRGKSKELATEQTETVWAATYDLLRSLRLTTFFGNPGELDIVSTAKGFGCATVGARTKQEIQEAFSNALNAHGPTVIAVPIKHQIRPLVPLVPEEA